MLEARDGIEGLRALLAQPVDAVICDLEMPGLDGEKLLAAQRGRTGGEEMPFLFNWKQYGAGYQFFLLRDAPLQFIEYLSERTELKVRSGRWLLFELKPETTTD